METQCLEKVLPLLIALLAVVVGPWVAFMIGKKQIEASAHTTNRQIIAPLRQQWINTLRDSISEFCSRATAYKMQGTTKNTAEDQLKIFELSNQIELFLNQNESEHNDLFDCIAMVKGNLTSTVPADIDQFWDAEKNIRTKTKIILKKEWERVKTEI